MSGTSQTRSRSPSSDCIRCSTAGRNPLASWPSRRTATRAACGAWGWCRTWRTRSSMRSTAPGDRAYALQHHRLLLDRERAAGARALSRRAHRAGPQRQPHQRRRASRRARGAGFHLRVVDGLRGDRSSPRPIERAATRGAPRRRAARRRGRLQPRRDPRRHAARGARSARVASARDRPARTARRVFGSETCALDIVGATYERDLEPGEIIAIDDEGERSIFPFEKKELKRCVFEHVYFARPDSRDLRRLGRSCAPRARTPSRSRVSCTGRGARVQRARLVELGGDRVRRGERAARTSWRSFAITTSAGRSSSPRRRRATRRCG